MERKPKYAGLSIALGAGLGAVFGVIAGHVGVWLGIGLAVGIALGATLRPKEPRCPQCAAIHRAHGVRR